MRSEVEDMIFYLIFYTNKINLSKFKTEIFLFLLEYRLRSFDKKLNYLHIKDIRIAVTHYLYFYKIILSLTNNLGIASTTVQQ